MLTKFSSWLSSPLKDWEIVVARVLILYTLVNGTIVALTMIVHGLDWTLS